MAGHGLQPPGHRAENNVRKKSWTITAGTVPHDPDVLATFPGIGPATASSICAFAFNLPVVFIETNIRRVFIHFFFPDAETVTDKEVLPLVERALDREKPRVWYWALMDLGAELKKSVTQPEPEEHRVHEAGAV